MVLGTGGCRVGFFDVRERTGTGILFIGQSEFASLLLCGHQTFQRTFLDPYWRSPVQFFVIL